MKARVAADSVSAGEPLVPHKLLTESTSADKHC